MSGNEPNQSAMSLAIAEAPLRRRELRIGDYGIRRVARGEGGRVVSVEGLNLCPDGVGGHGGSPSNAVIRG
jgi:hypothetical protein